MEEYFGEREHQNETRANARHGGSGDFFTCKRTKGKDETLSNNPKVQAAKTEIVKKRKRTNVVMATQTALVADTKRAKNAKQRSDALTTIAPNRKLVSLVEKRKQLLSDQATWLQQ